MAKNQARLEQEREPTRRPQRRRSSNADPARRFDIDPRIVPEGIDYNWKRITVYGQTDEEHQIDLAESGWTPVPAERHPDKAGRNVKPDSMIIRGGLVLMERPKSFTEEARAEDLSEARQQMRTQFVRLGQTQKGQLQRQKPRAVRTFEAAEVPEDAA